MYYYGRGVQQDQAQPTVGTIVPLIKAWRGRSTISDSFTTMVAELKGIQRKLTTGTGKPLIKVMNLLNVPSVSKGASVAPGV